MTTEPQDKFEDCKDCRFRRNPNVCRGCEAGENFEEKSSRQELDFNDGRDFARLKGFWYED